MYLCEPAGKAGVESVEPDYEVKKEFSVICVTRLDNLMVDVENTYLPLRKRFRLKKKFEKSFATGLTMTIASV